MTGVPVVAAILATFVAAALYQLQVVNQPCHSDPPVTVELRSHDTSGAANEEENVGVLRIPNLSTCSFFSEDYVTARQRFREAAGLANTTTNPLMVQGDDYTMDVAVIAGEKPGLVVHVSGTHGVEGYAGSAIQIAFLRHLTASSLPNLPTVILVHAFNPVGMAANRRGNEHNVDLNRNALTPDEWHTHAARDGNRADYDLFRTLFLPPPTPTKTTVSSRRGVWLRWPRWRWFVFVHVTSWLRLAWAAARHGAARLRKAMVSAQYHTQTGIFYGGGDGSNIKIEPSIRLLENWMHGFLQQKSPNTTLAVTWIDVHTGLGPMGHDTLLPSMIGVSTEAKHREEWRSQNVLPWFKSPFSDAQARNAASSTMQGYEDVKGLTVDYYARMLFPDGDRNILLMVQEFGTIPSVLVGHSLVVENTVYHDTTLTAEQKLAWAKRTTRRAFCPESTKWRRLVLHGGLRVLYQAIHRSVQLAGRDRTAKAASSTSTTA